MLGLGNKPAKLRLAVPARLKTESKTESKTLSKLKTFSRNSDSKRNSKRKPKRTQNVYCDIPYCSLPRASKGAYLSPAPSPRSIMSTVPSSSLSNFASIFNAALESYKRKTKNDLASHPLLPNLQSCESPEAVLTVLRDQVPAFNQSRNGDDGLTKWVTPTVNVLYSFSGTIGQGVGLVNID
jgi:hypothetical protein